MAYEPHHLETAACLWEAVTEMERCGEFIAGDPDQEALGAAIRAAREALGSSALRRVVIGWTDEVDASWLRVDGMEHGRRLGLYAGAFDWEFVPDWIALNVDWSDPNAPTLNSPLRDPANPVA